MARTILKVCNIPSSQSVEDFYECFQNVTINGPSMVSRTRKFTFQNFTFENSRILTWKSFWSFYFGHCFTSNDFYSLKDGQFLKIYLNKYSDYLIWIHDPDFFYLSLNPRSIPKVEIEFSPVINSQTSNIYSTVLQYIEQEKHTKLHREKVRMHVSSIADKQL